MRGGSKKWTLSNLPPRTSEQFTTELVPLLKEQLAGSETDPWLNPPLSVMQAQVDRVYGDGKYVVHANDVWAHLVRGISVPGPERSDRRFFSSNIAAMTGGVPSWNMRSRASRTLSEHRQRPRRRNLRRN